MRRFTQVDVFASRPQLGNPVAVVHDAEGLSEDMASFARWTNLSETTFLMPPTTDHADYRVRIFTPAEELPFAGHPTMGSAHAWLEAGGAPVRRRGRAGVRGRSGAVAARDPARLRGPAAGPVGAGFRRAATVGRGGAGSPDELIDVHGSTTDPAGWSVATGRRDRAASEAGLVVLRGARARGRRPVPGADVASGGPGWRSARSVPASGWWRTP